MRGSSRMRYQILNQDEPVNKMIADCLCDLEERLQQGYIPNTFEKVLDMAIDYIRSVN